VIFVSGCSGVSVQEPVKISDEDWLMAGGNTLQQNIARSILVPPLQMKWNFDMDAGAGYSGISVADAVVFANCLSGDMFCIDVSSGARLGRLNFLGKDAMTTPLVLGNDVIVSFAGDNKTSLISYNIQSGLTNWTTNLGYLQTSPICDSGYVYTGSLNGNFYKVKSGNGKREWKFDTKAHIHSTCAIDGANVIFGNDEGIVFCLTKDDGILKWEFSASGSVVAPPMIAGGKIFFGSYDSCYYCLNEEDGSLLWKKNLSTKILGGSALYDSSNVIFGCVDGNLYSLKCADGSVNWVFASKGVIGSSPLVSGSLIYFTSYDFNIYCLDGKDGKEIWNYVFEGKSKTSPVIWKDFLFVVGDEQLYCFEKQPEALNK